MSDELNQSQLNRIHSTEYFIHKLPESMLFVLVDHDDLLSSNTSLRQVTSLSNVPMTTLPKINKNDEEDNYSQQLRETDIEIRLDDCMQCRIRIPRCEGNI